VLKVFTAEAIRTLDRRAAELGVAPLLLMESAGRGTAEAIRAWNPDLGRGRVLAVCGPGGNGGDALSAARWLGLAGADVRAVILGSPTGPAADQERAFRASFPDRIRSVKNAGGLDALRTQVAEADLVLDGILGIGVTDGARGLPRKAIGILNDSAAPVAALDLPSGLIADRGIVPGPAVRAGLTLAMGALKPCHLLPPAAELCGEVQVVDVVYPPSLWGEVDPAARVVDGAFVASLVPRRSRFGHKGTFGKVLVVGGAVGMAGAPALAAEGALRAGAGLVHVLCPELVFPIVAGLVPEALVHPGPAADGMLSRDAADEARRWAREVDVMVIGPGLGRGPGPQSLVEALLRTRAPLVLDADALFALAQDTSLLRGERGEIVLTPHPGEFARLVGANPDEVVPDKIRWARETAREWRATVALKGPPTAVATSGGDVYLTRTGNTALAHGGSGDVLAGVIGSLWAGGATPQGAATAGAYVHGLAAKLASAGASERAILPREVLSSLPEAFACLERHR
jgi:NAD(P)H-hydrate epimerase